MTRRTPGKKSQSRDSQKPAGRTGERNSDRSTSSKTRGAAAESSRTFRSDRGKRDAGERPKDGARRDGARGETRGEARGETRGEGRYEGRPEGRRPEDRSARGQDARRSKPAPRDNIVAGRHAVKAVLEGQPKRAKKLLVSSTRSDPVVDKANANGIAIEHVDKQRLDELAPGLLHQGYVLEVAPYPYVDLEEALAAGCRLALVLDEVEDPRNLGAAARAAYALGADLLIIPERRAARVTASAEKTAAGALAHIRVARPPNLRRALQLLKDDGMWIVGGDHRTDLAPWDVDLSDRAVIIVGAEEDGMRRLTREACDHVVSIPMAAQGMSLNAADAATVLLYEASRQRSAKASKT